MFTLLHFLLGTLSSITASCLALPLGFPYPSYDRIFTYSNTSHPDLTASSGQDPTCLDDILSRRDFVWTDTTNQAQSLCGNSTIAVVDSDIGDSDSYGDRPGIEDCQQFVYYAKTRNGYWLVTGFSAEDQSWVQFSTLATCKIGVRRTDGETGTVPIGNQDVIDLLNSVMSLYGEGGTLPPTQGNMSCSRGTTKASVEWHIYND
ncbi:hypothetical protein M406DRAFT_66089 [Cryphonectria parasitica EP155]|uniref:Ecp2 effector protein-like domain-containing protein n=1 Tax=Cryphonectria parasitica (strain ATCC 38755 / EP155) TaxID=660469 RepID=A0A9P4YAT8_CRYP1|nr:uncharacterized protein M406DRAFT_66089 [Cryphonectria parasitica EP155]KAF3769604.1 hypothetical protein M406DRAFT_66089 [Cryphonectria parasitica EP155]